jgi:cell division protein FtsQ
MIKKILIISFWVLMLGGLVVSLGFIATKQKTILCKSLTINIDHSKDDYFVEEEDIRAILSEKGDTIKDQPLSNINIGMLEKIIKNNPFVENAEVYSSIGGEVEIDVKQRNPIVRINGQKDNFYMDENGVFMPLSDKYTARVIVVSGYIFEPYAYGEARLLSRKNDEDTLYFPNIAPYKYSLKDTLFTLAKFINASDFWKAEIEQVYVTQNHEMELVPTVGNHRIVLGDISDMEEKFNKLMIFYQKGLSKTGWNKYSIINLKYKDQVVCTKK